MADTLQQLAQLSDPQLDLALGALLVAREVHFPGIDPAAWLRRLDGLADDVRPRLPDHDLYARLERVLRFLFEEQQFRGNAVDYYDPRNSLLNEVLARRLGIPITLSLLLVEVGRRVGLDLYGVGLPGHFVVGGRLGDGHVYVDPFHRGAELDAAGMARLVEQATGTHAVLDSAWLNPVQPRDFLARICGNLQGAYARLHDWPRAVLATERLLLFSHDATAVRDLGYLCVQAGYLGRAGEALRAYLELEPDAEDGDAVREALADIAYRLALLN